LLQVKALRKLSFLSLLPHAAQGLTEESFNNSFWPLPGDPEPVVFDPVLEAETYNAIIKAHNLKIQKGRRNGN